MLAVVNDAFRFAIGDWHLAAIHMQGCALDVPTYTAAGFPVCRYAAPGPWDAIPDALRPMHFGLTRRAALAMLPGTSVRQAFGHYPPRFRLSASQRRLLWLALFDDSDEALIARLGFSVHAPKKLWRGIYERIEDVTPGFFGDDGADDEGPARAREAPPGAGLRAPAPGGDAALGLSPGRRPSAHRGRIDQRAVVWPWWVQSESVSITGT